MPMTIERSRGAAALPAATAMSSFRFGG